MHKTKIKLFRFLTEQSNIINVSNKVVAKTAGKEEIIKKNLIIINWRYIM